jgi:hypothetical protein
MQVCHCDRDLEWFFGACCGLSFRRIGSECAGLHNAVLNGDTITLPTGTSTWTTGVSISKAIKIQGAGSGRIVGNTKSQTTIGTGSKTFTTTRVIAGISAGQTLRIAKMPTFHGPARENYMEGTVTSYSGTTLVMNDFWRV